MTNARRATLISSVCLTAAVAACLVPGSASAQFAPDTITIAPAAQLSPDGTLTLSGTYRCSSLRSGPVLIGAKAVQHDTRATIDGARAICDDRVHTWRERAEGEGTFRAGAAHGEAVLIHLDSSQSFVPLPVILNADDRNLTVRQG
ncbi:DUF6299 family protein [Streptomyces sp. NPDC000594]|uniref:DUF6299 family protein n=1 Tax=Streptomyces sp. NPDC000594 TaxID=3154261 RepID=UPI003317218E